MKRLLVLVVLLAIVGVGGLYYMKQQLAGQVAQQVTSYVPVINQKVLPPVNNQNPAVDEQQVVAEEEQSLAQDEANTDALESSVASEDTQSTEPDAIEDSLDTTDLDQDLGDLEDLDI